MVALGGGGGLSEVPLYHSFIDRLWLIDDCSLFIVWGVECGRDAQIYWVSLSENPNSINFVFHLKLHFKSPAQLPEVHLLPGPLLSQASG